MQKVIVLPKDDQEMEELMLEEVEVFKVGVTPQSCSHPDASQNLLTSDLQGRAGGGVVVPRVQN